MVRWLVVVALLFLVACSGGSGGSDGGQSGDLADGHWLLDTPDGTVPEPADDASLDATEAPDQPLTDATDTLPEMVAEVVEDVAPDLPPEIVSPPATIDDFLTLTTQSDAAALDAFLAQYDGPFCEAARCLFVTCLQGADAVALRGEFSDWEELPMTAIDFAPGCFYHLFEELLFNHVVEYKLFANQEWLSDPLNPYFRFADVAVNSALYAPGVGRLALIEAVYSPQLDNSRNLYVYLPAPAFENSGQTFPVLYMQDGFNVFENPSAPFGSWEVDVTADLLIADGDIEPLIIVGIDTNDRFNEYLYTDVIFDMGDEFIIVDPKLPEYGQFLVDTVKPLIDARFPTRLQPENTAIAGSSLGGISALYLGWYFADTFGKVASLSGSYWIGETLGTANNPALRDLLLAYEPTYEQLQLTIYLDSGSAPPEDPTPHPYEYDARCYTDWTRNALLELGWSNRMEWDDDGLVETPPGNFSVDSVPGDVPTLFWAMAPPADYSNWDDFLLPGANMLHLVGGGQGHNEAAWALRFPATLRFLFAP
jgi:predicted alpha/beta superfamily hydrolase